MRQFDRRFDTARARSSIDDNRWFRDLLAMWAPAGVAASFGEEETAKNRPRAPCLRLAVRDPGIDMYRAGQCLASIKFGSKLGLRSKIHHKYVPAQASDEDHVYVNRRGVHFDNETVVPYRGPSDLADWLGRAEDYKRGKEKEKKFVDLICGANANVVDLEIGLPAGEEDEKRVAPRMDLVALERTETDRWRIVFWEAKLAGNPELRRQPNDQKKGNIFDQVSTYERWLIRDNNEALVADAYHRACKILVELHEIAREYNADIGALGEGIVELAGGTHPPEIDPKPRVIIDDRGTKTNSLAANDHLERLEKAEIRYQLVTDKSDFVLGSRF